MLHELQARSWLQRERNRCHASIAESGNDICNHLRAAPTVDPVGEPVLGYTLDVDSSNVRRSSDGVVEREPTTNNGALRNPECVGEVDEADVLKGKGQ